MNEKGRDKPLTLKELWAGWRRHQENKLLPQQGSVDEDKGEGDERQYGMDMEGNLRLKPEDKPQSEAVKRIRRGNHSWMERKDM